VQVVALDAELPPQDIGRCGGGGQGDEPSAVLAQHVGVGAHRGRLARPGRADSGQQQPLVARERGHQDSLAGVQRGVAAGLEPVQRGGHRQPRNPVAGRGPGGVQQPLLGIEYGLAGVPAGGVLGEHRLAVGAAQLGRLVQQRRGLHRDRVPGRDREGGNGVGEVAVPCRVQGWDAGAELAFGFGADVPGRPR
jgi:hypothetical protein